MLRSDFAKLLTIGVVPLALTACANFESISAEFEESWENPRVSMTPEAEALVALTDEQILALSNELSGLSARTDCERIQAINVRLATTEQDNLAGLSKVAECDYRAGDYASARRQYQQWVDQDGAADAYAGLGLSYLQSGHLTQAEEALEMALEIDPELTWNVHNGLGYIYDQAEDWPAAEYAYRVASDMNPDSGVPHNNLGMSYMRQQRYQDAIEAFGTALLRSPDLHIARLNLRTAFSMTGDLATAFSGASDAERAAILNNSGVAALADGDVEEASSLFNQALLNSPVFYPNAYNNLQRARIMAAASETEQVSEEDAG